VAVSGTWAYVADLNLGVQVVDLSNPAAPVSAGVIGTPGAASGVVVLGTRLLVAGGFSGLLEFDVSDPRSPVLTGRYDTPGVATAVAVGDDVVLIADGVRGIRSVRLNPPLPPSSAGGATRLEQVIPAGFTPGPYDVMVTSAGPGTESVLHDGFVVCGGGSLTAELVPSRPPASVVGPTPVAWRLLVGGDDAWFRPEPRHDARLLLPALPGDVGISFVRGREAIELRMPAGQGETARVVLSGADGAAMRALWDAIAARGGIDLPRLDAASYGEFRLGLAPGTGAGAPARYRFEFEAGRLAAARAWGESADLRFQVIATDPAGCGAEATTLLGATVTPAEPVATAPGTLRPQEPAGERTR
jgi:hypothetical protein